MLKRKFILFIALCSLPSFPVHAAEVYDAPSGNAFKTFMDAGSIKNKTSSQYALQQQAETLDNGLRVLDDRYMVAIGTGFHAEVGDLVDVCMESGTTLKCVVGDIKRDVDTDETNKQIPHNGNVVEFIVDTDKLDKSVVYAGDVSKIDGFEGEIDSLVVNKDEDIPDEEDTPESVESVSEDTDDQQTDDWQPPVNAERTYDTKPIVEAEQQPDILLCKTPNPEPQICKKLVYFTFASQRKQNIPTFASLV